MQPSLVFNFQVIKQCMINILRVIEQFTLNKCLTEQKLSVTVTIFVTFTSCRRSERSATFYTSIDSSKIILRKRWQQLNGGRILI